MNVSELELDKFNMMNLQENIQRIKEVMGIDKPKKEIYNLDLVELGGSMSDFMRIYSKDEPITKIEKKDDFSESQIKDIVWRAGELKLNPKAGGIWFADSKEGVEKFALSVRGEVREGKPYYINIKNPYFFEDGFWRGYINQIGYDSYGRQQLMRKLQSEGYDGIIINDDWWNDTGDDNAVYGKQYIVFDENDVKSA